MLAKYSYSIMSESEVIFVTSSHLDMCGCSLLSYLGLGAPGCFGVPSSAGGTCADQSRAGADTDRSCCCLSGTGA